MPGRWDGAVPKTNGGVDVPAAVAEDEPEEAVEEREAGEEATRGRRHPARRRGREAANPARARVVRGCSLQAAQRPAR